MGHSVLTNILFIINTFVAGLEYIGPISDSTLEGGISLRTEQTSATIENCQSSCDSNSECLSLSYDELNGLCSLFSSRLALSGTNLVKTLGWDYYEVKIGERESLDSFLVSRRATVGTNSYQTYLRESLALMLTSSDGLMVEVEDLEECAIRCLREKGVVDEYTGDRCKSFDFYTTINDNNLYYCSLLYEDLQTSDATWAASSNVEHYEKLQGAGCWVFTSECSNYLDWSYVDVQPSASNVLIYETACHGYTRTYHESVCGADKVVPTWAWFGPTGALNVWNPVDFTTGCVIEAGFCNYLPINNGTWRDTIGEWDLAASEIPVVCLNRAEKWHTLCEKPDSSKVYAKYVDTGARMGYPVPVCECDATIGQLVDPTTLYNFCRLIGTDVCKMSDGISFFSRPDINTDYDGMPYEDLVCDNVDCPVLDTTSTSCMLLSGICMTGVYSTGDDDVLELGETSTEAECHSKAEKVWAECENTASQYVDVYYVATGNIVTFPEMHPTVSAIDGMSAMVYNVPDSCESSPYENCTFLSASQDRWQSFKAPDDEKLETNIVRGLSFLWKGTEDTEFNLMIIEGYRYRPDESSTIVVDTSMDIEASADPIWVTIPLNLDLTANNYYTAVVQVTGDIAYDAEVDYPDGSGDTIWDYAFILWQYKDTVREPPAEMNVVVKFTKDRTFEYIFISMLGLCLIIPNIAYYFERRKRKRADAQYIANIEEYEKFKGEESDQNMGNAQSDEEEGATERFPDEFAMEDFDFEKGIVKSEHKEPAIEVATQPVDDEEKVKMIPEGDKGSSDLESSEYEEQRKNLTSAGFSRGVQNCLESDHSEDGMLPNYPSWQNHASGVFGTPPM